MRPERARTHAIEIITVAVIWPILLLSLCTKGSQGQAVGKVQPTFTLSVEEDKVAERANPGYYRIQVSLTHIGVGVELEQFHSEAENMCNMIVLRDGVLASETEALRALRAYRNDPLSHNRKSESAQNW
jgi:hypothetical protein